MKLHLFLSKAVKMFIILWLFNLIAPLAPDAISILQEQSVSANSTIAVTDSPIEMAHPNQQSRPPIHPQDFSNRFQERTVFTLKNPCQAYPVPYLPFLDLVATEYFTTHHGTRYPIRERNGCLPSRITFDGQGSITFRDKGAIILSNPWRDEPFYRIEVTIEDNAGHTNSRAIMTLLDNLWGNGQPAGISVGTNVLRDVLSESYGYHSTQFNYAKDVNGRAKKFATNFAPLKRITGPIKLEVYVTPIGMYPVLNGANLASFPYLDVGSFIFDVSGGYKVNHIVLGKWDNGGHPVTFKEIKIVKLDNQVDTVHEVNAHFIKKAVDDQVSITQVNVGANEINTTRALWRAFLYRGHDYYFDRQGQGVYTMTVQNIFTTTYLPGLKNEVNKMVQCYGQNLDQPPNSPCPTNLTFNGLGLSQRSENIFQLNHTFVNGLHAHLLIAYAISDYLSEDQKKRLQKQFRKVIDITLKNIHSDGTFPFNTQAHACITYKGDTFTEEVSWLINLYTGYYLNFPNDTEWLSYNFSWWDEYDPFGWSSSPQRSALVLDMIKFLSFHRFSMGKSIQDVYPELSFNYLPYSFKRFTSRYVHNDGKLDNHGFHPSLNYALGATGSATLVQNLLKKNGISFPTLRHNLKSVYWRSVYDTLDIETFHLKKEAGIKRWNFIRTNDEVDCSTFLPEHGDDYREDQNKIIGFSGEITPSRLEDWSHVYIGYNAIQDHTDQWDNFYGDFGHDPDLVARNLYYLFYTGTGILFCNLERQCSAGKSDVAHIIFPQSLYAMAFSDRSNFLDGRTQPTPTPTPTPRPTPTYSPKPTPTNRPYPPNLPSRNSRQVNSQSEETYPVYLPLILHH